MNDKKYSILLIKKFAYILLLASNNFFLKETSGKYTSKIYDVIHVLIWK